MKDWAEIREWRRSQRKRLLAERTSLSRQVRTTTTSAIAGRLADEGPSLDKKCIGFYWPIKGEVDLVAFIRLALRRAQSAGLPVIVEKDQPLEFWRWTSRTELCSRGIWNVPAPAERVLVVPDILFVPLLGFDEAGYRLGYGSGYYDRTLAAAVPRPLTVGIAHDAARLQTIHPQPHDIGMDMIVTESGLTRFATQSA